MTMPGFTAEAVLGLPTHRYRKLSKGGVGTAPQRLPLSIQPAYVCDALFCQCTGTPDCDAMFTAPGLCGTWASCTGDTCTCARIG